MAALERRASVTLECRAQENKLVGIAAPYSTWSSTLYIRAGNRSQPFIEQIQKGAFDKSLQEDDIKALIGHDSTMVLGRTKSQTLTVRSTDEGLAFELQLPNHDLGQRIREMVARGDMGECSFGFFVRENGDIWDKTNSLWKRTLVDVELKEISFVIDPAYPEGTSIQLRDLRSVYLHHMRSHAERWLAVEKLRFPQRRQHGS